MRYCGFHLANTTRPEEEARTCPADCPGGCVEGEILPYSCPDTSQIAWCTCTGGQWDCADPVATCPGDTLCAQTGGACVDNVCQYDIQTISGAICDPVQSLCVQ